MLKLVDRLHSSSEINSLTTFLSLSIKVIFRQIVFSIFLCLDRREIGTTLSRDWREKESLPALKPSYGDAVEL